MTAPSRTEILYGTDEPVPPRRRLSAGALSAEFDRGSLRCISWGGLEIIRAVSFTVRDTGWGTCDLALSDLSIEERPDVFTVTFRASCENDSEEFSFDAAIHGHSEGQLSYSAQGNSSTGFSTNRTGFVVLNPLEGVVGERMEIERASGGTVSARFPLQVDPFCPATDIKAISHALAPGLKVTVRMAGEAFEMEDHRNWTDASFKTYVRPLALGFPYRIAPGEQIEQTIEITVEGPPPAVATGRDEAVITIGAPAGPMPKMGLFVERDGIDDARAVADRAAKIGVAFLKGRLDLRTGDVGDQLAGLSDLCRTIRAPLALEVIVPGLSPKAELAPLAEVIRDMEPDIESLLLTPARDLKMRPANTLPEGEADAAAILAAARALFPDLRIGGGMIVPFPELNRNRPSRDTDFITHATQATMHEADDRSVMETLEALPHIIRSTRAFAGDVPYRIGPATIGMPAYSSASHPIANPLRRRICMAGDEPRQRGLFAAAFALGYAAIAAREGIEALTFAAPAGLFGLFEAETRRTRPIAAVVEGLAALQHERTIACGITGTGNVAALAARGKNGPTLWLANLQEAPVQVRYEGAQFRFLRMIDAAAQAVEDVAEEPFPGKLLKLDSYAVAILR